MKTIFKNEWRLSRKSLMIWAGIMLLLVTMAVIEFGALKNAMKALAVTVEAFPKILRIMFGINDLPIDTVMGAYACMYFWYTLIAYPYAASLGAYIVTKEEMFRTAEFLYTKPHQRSTVLTAKCFVALANMAILVIITAASTIFFLLPVIDGFAILPQVLLTMLGMFLTQLVFMAVGMLCAAISKRGKTALFLSIAFLILSYVLAFTIEYTGSKGLDMLTPVRYFNVALVLQKGIVPSYLILALLIAGLSLFLAGKLYKKKDFNL